jgi:hypothetical protein
MSLETFDRRHLLSVLAGTSAAYMSCGFSGDENVDAAGVGIEGGRAASGSIQLQVIGSLGVGHIQSCLGFIGVIADTVTKDIYSQKQIEDLMRGTVNGLELPKKMLRRLQDTKISDEDKEFLDRMIGVFNALQMEANSVTAFAKSRKVDDAQKFERDRRLVLRKLADLTQRDEFYEPEAAPQRGQVPQIEPAPRAVPLPDNSPKSRTRSGSNGNTSN